MRRRSESLHRRSDMRLVLASQSPRRAALLRAAGFEFDITDPAEVPAPIDETRHEGEDPVAYVARLGHAKAYGTAPRYPDCCVIGAQPRSLWSGRFSGSRATTMTQPGCSGYFRGGPIRSDRRCGSRGRTAGERGGRDACPVRAAARRRDRMVRREWRAARQSWRVCCPGASGPLRDRDRRGAYTNVVGLPVAILHRLLVRMDALAAHGEPGDRLV